MSQSALIPAQIKAAIEATDLVMQFDARRLFSAQKLRFEEGDVIYLQGDNGSGKSSLMKILAGLINKSLGFKSK